MQNEDYPDSLTDLAACYPGDFDSLANDCRTQINTLPLDRQSEIDAMLLALVLRLHSNVSSLASVDAPMPIL